MRLMRAFLQKKQKTLWAFCFCAIWFFFFGSSTSAATADERSIDSLHALLAKTHGEAREDLWREIGYLEGKKNIEKQLTPELNNLRSESHYASEKIRNYQLQRNIMIGATALVLFGAFAFSFFQRGSFKELVPAGMSEEDADAYKKDVKKDAIIKAGLKEANEAIQSLQSVLAEKKAELSAAIALRKEQADLIESQNAELININEELQTTLEEVRSQKELIEDKNDKINASIEYAYRIQHAVLPAHELFAAVFPKHFVFNRPRDIISGDFYWLARHGSLSFLALADCTGHGVPGAFMSLIGINLLNQIVNELNLYSPDSVLQELDRRVRAALRQNKTSDNHDGMDIIFCVFDFEMAELSFAAANRPLYFLRDGKLTEHKGERYPIGGSQHQEKKFTKQSIYLRSGDRIYLFSDGVTDQFGGPQKRKLTPQRLQNFIIEHKNQSIQKQFHIFTQYFTEWQGTYDQLDDVAFIGVEV